MERALPCPKLQSDLQEKDTCNSKHMKQNTAEIMKNNNAELGNLKQMLESGQMNVLTIEMDASEAEEDARSLELELMQAQAAHERKEKAEQQGKETSEKIAELVG